MIALLLALTVHATQVQQHTVPCPIGGEAVVVYEKISADTMGGYDSDLASYASQGQWRQYAVSTCPKSLLSLYGDDMLIPLIPEAQARVNKALDALRPKLGAVDAANMPVWQRYWIAAQVYDALGREPLFVAQVWLDGSHAARDAAVGLYMGLSGPAAARAVLDAGKAELGKPLSLAQRKTVLYNLARVAERGGYNKERDRYLADFEAAGGLDAAEQAALTRFRAMTRAESALQDQAILSLQDALTSQKLTESERLRATYLLGDLQRRRGQLDGARRNLTAALQFKDESGDLQQMARELLGELGT